MVVAGTTMLVGVLGAIAQDDVKRILSFLIISSIGFMVMGMALFTVAGIAAAIVYMVHQVVLKTALFLAGGMIEHAGGSSRLSRLGDMARTAPMIAVIFFVPAMSLAGIPPMSGFTAKFALFDSVAESSRVVDPRRGHHRRAADPVLDRQDLDRRVLGPGRSRPRPARPRRSRSRPPMMMLAPTVVLVARRSRSGSPPVRSTTTACGRPATWSIRRRTSRSCSGRRRS